MKRQYFSRPDLYFGKTGDLRHSAVNVSVPGAPAFMKGLRAVFLSDLHVLPRTTDGQIKAFVECIKAMGPDILFMGGDYAEMQADAQRLYEQLASVEAPLGKFAVIGNNDRQGWADPDAPCAAMKACGIQTLVNASVRIPVNGGELIVAGVDEHLAGEPQGRGLYPEVPSENMYRILLSHYPCMPDVIPDLMLSGHTHGGQFNFLGITPYAVGFERIMNREISSEAISGMHDMGGGRLFVGKGVGASRLQLRIGVRPEIYALQFEC